MNASKNKPLVFKKKVLRKIFGPVKENQTKQKLANLNKELDVMKCIRIARLRWAGHFEGMDETSTPRKSAGKGKWVDHGVSANTTTLGIRNWWVT